MADVKKIATRVSYGEALVELANEHDDFVVLDADLAAATQTGKFKAACPDRFFDVGIAESNGLTEVFIANHGGDHAIYPDCRQDFITAIDAAAKAGTYVGVRIVAPYTSITKADIARIGKRLGIDYAETWSCYKGGEKHCGKCGTCVERKEALAEAGIEDKTEYLE